MSEGQYVVTPFKTNLFRTIFVTLWKRRISITYTCRVCKTQNIVTVPYREAYPQYLCRKCEEKNVINLKYQ